MYKTPHVIFLCGLPGSGKSTWAQKICEQYSSSDYNVLSTDALYEERAHALGWSYNEAFERISFSVINEEFMERLICCVYNKENIIIDQTNLTKQSRKKKLDRFTTDYLLVAHVFKLSPLELAQRLKKRYYETGKYIPTDIIKRMNMSWEKPDGTEFDYILIKE